MSYFKAKIRQIHFLRGFHPSLCWGNSQCSPSHLTGFKGSYFYGKERGWEGCINASWLLGDGCPCLQHLLAHYLNINNKCSFYRFASKSVISKLNVKLLLFIKFTSHFCSLHSQKSLLYQKTTVLMMLL